MRFLTLAAVVSIVPLSGQASYVNYGHGCNAFGSEAQIGIRGLPRIGTSIIISGSGGSLNLSRPYSIIKYLATGSSRTSYLGWPLPFRIPPQWINYGGLDCDVLCSHEWVQNAYGGEILMDIPNDHRLVCMKLYQQWYFLVVVRAIPIFDFWFVSSGGEMTIGM
jgi:hypothetical protein